MAPHPREVVARENRVRILAAAMDVIEREGTMASLNEIAKLAGVGAGTLYRHFPNRDALLAEVLSTWISRVSEAAEGWTVTSRSDLVDYLEHVAGIANSYRGLSSVIAATMDDEESPLHDAHGATLTANDVVFDRAREAGLVAGPVDARNVALLVTGVAMVADQSDMPRAQLRAMLEVVLAGLVGDQA